MLIDHQRYCNYQLQWVHTDSSYSYTVCFVACYDMEIVVVAGVLCEWDSRRSQLA